MIPAFRVRINGSDLPAQAAADVTAVTVHEDVAALSMFTLSLINWDMTRLRVVWSDDTLFAEGNEVEVLMGYTGSLKPLMVGEITGLEPDFQVGEIPMLTVRGYDRRHRLLRGRKTRSFVAKKDSDIAREIAGEQGLAAEVQDTGLILDYVLQHNQTDMEFLRDRAWRLGYEIAVERKKLCFRPPRIQGSPVVSLDGVKDLIEFSPRLSTLAQVGEVTVRGWDPKQGKVINGKASSVTASMGRSPGPRNADKAFGKASAASVDRPVFSRAEADKIAQQRLNEMALAHISGEGVSVGRSDLRAGTLIEINGLGQRFSGSYYLTSVTHRITPSRGYETAFTVRRNAT